jgi:sugar-specific transcriptional regulator TrmB
MGLITKSDTYPELFTAIPFEEAHSLYLLHQSSQFLQKFSRQIQSKSELSFSFIQSRDELMKQSTIEVNQACKSVDLLRSGAEFPADLLLAITEANKRGVTTRMLIQDYSPENAGLVDNWKANQIQVRVTQLKHLRLMIYDCTTVYFMSYRHTDSERDLGFKINYPPFAAILSQQFEQWWKVAKTP